MSVSSFLHRAFVSGDGGDVPGPFLCQKKLGQQGITGTSAKG